MTLKVGDTIKGVASQTEYTVVYVLNGAGHNYVLQDKNGVDYFTTQPKNYTKVGPDPYPIGTVLAYYDSGPEGQQRVIYFKDAKGEWHRLSSYHSDAETPHKKVPYGAIELASALKPKCLVTKQP